jgi:hypothetical protein
MTETIYWGVYRVLSNGTEIYVPCTVTANEKLAREIARDFSEGRVVRPDGSEMSIPARPHIAKIVEAKKSA